MSTDANGATVNPHATNSDTCTHPPDRDGKVRTGNKHIWRWVWKNGHITDKVECTACGEVRFNTDKSNLVFSKPYRSEPDQEEGESDAEKS